MEIQTKLNWEDFEPLFGTWTNKFKKFFDSGGFDPIYDKLKKDSKRGKQIAPLAENVFKAFQKTSFEEVKCIIIGLSPYHTFYNNKPIADGICMGCSITGKLQPSLSLFYKAMEEELANGLNLHMIKDPDLSYLCEQGVLLINTSLTVEKMKPGNHNFLWEPFMKHLFEECIITTGMPVIFLGKESLKVERYIGPFTWVFKLTHPASASYNNTDWDSEGVFLKVNEILKGNNNTTINWIKTE